MTTARLSTKKQFSRHRILGFAAIAALLGLTAVFVVSAAGVTSSFESEKGTLGSPAKKVTDASASAGSAVQFGTPAGSGFITRSGRNFIKDGQVFKFHGFNSYGMAGCYNGTAYTSAQLDSYFSSLPAHGVTRLWAFRTYGTARIQTILTAAAKYNQHVILTLADTISACGDTDYSVSGDHSGKIAAYYDTGWKNEWSTWVNTIVPLFKNNPTIMMWEVSNEPGVAGQKPTHTVMQAYFKGTSDLIRSLDPNHLITIGANAPGDFGGSSNYISLWGTANIDAISFHDYAYEYEGGTAVSNNYNVAKQASTTHNKPFFGGEAGQPSGASGCAVSLTARAAYMKTKADAYFAGGIGGLTYWQYAPSKASWVANCAYETYPGDPLITQVKNYLIP
jgi:hypothetical protein